MVVIRLSLQGRKNRAFYFIVAADKRQKRSSFIEKIGYFDPLTKKLHLNTERHQYWLNHGAQVTLSCQTRVKEWRNQSSQSASIPSTNMETRENKTEATTV